MVTAIIYYLCQLKAPGTAQGPHSIAVPALPPPRVCFSRRPELVSYTSAQEQDSGRTFVCLLPWELQAYAQGTRNSSQLSAATRLKGAVREQPLHLTLWTKTVAYSLHPAPQNVAFWAARLKITLWKHFGNFLCSAFTQMLLFLPRSGCQIGGWPYSHLSAVALFVSFPGQLLGRTCHAGKA